MILSDMFSKMYLNLEEIGARDIIQMNAGLSLSICSLIKSTRFSGIVRFRVGNGVKL